VHHLFGDDVARRVESDYSDALITAHLEVPSAMFRLGLAAQRAGRGVVGSTSDILGFAERAVNDAIERRATTPLRLVLGTEAGMVTSLVRRIRSLLDARADHDVKVEIIFPVADQAVARTDDVSLPVVPGVAGGEGCSIEGGCATCPYMKMNSLDALFALFDRLGRSEADLLPFAPHMREGLIAGRPLIDWATAPIRFMREFTQTGRLPQALIDDVRSRAGEPIDITPST
jgi:quinolinate synthase